MGEMLSSSASRFESALIFSLRPDTHLIRCVDRPHVRCPIPFPSPGATQMSRRSFLLAAGFILFLIGGTGGGLIWMLRYEQPWYVEAAVPPGKQRKDLSKAFYNEVSNLLSWVASEGKEWEARFTDQQINSYFEEDFVQSGLSTRLLPEEVCHPRIVIEPDHFHLAFRYGSGAWSTLISIDFCVYLIRSERRRSPWSWRGSMRGRCPSPRSRCWSGSPNRTCGSRTASK